MKNRILILSLSISNVAFADFEVLNTIESNDPLSQLSRTLGQGSFSHPENIEVQSSSFQTATRSGNDSLLTSETLSLKYNSKKSETDFSNYISISSAEYKSLGGKPFYNDSDILFNKIDKEFVEFKDFPNNIKILNGLTRKASHIADMSIENPFSESWQVVCNKDHITDEKICILWKYELLITKSSRSGINLTMSKDLEKLNYKTSHFIRIDKNPVHSTKLDFTGGKAIKIIEEMKKGNMAYTRFREWGGQYEENIPLKGFSIAYNHMNLMYSRLK